MKKINFTEQVLPHVIAVVFFLVVTVFFFNPIFFDHKTLEQSDVTQFEGGAKALQDFREQTGEVALWAPSMFSGMPAYMISVKWSNEPLSYLKKIISLFLPHPVRNIFVAFLCYYILLLSFRVRPYLAIAGAVAFGLSSYMIIGLGAGHNARIGAIAYMPLVVAGIHLVFTNRKILGFGITAIGLALHLMENHLQITYYLLIVVGAYGIVQLINFIKAKQIVEFFKVIGLLIVAAALALASMIGPLWATSEYTTYSTRGKAVLTAPASTTAPSGSGVSKEYAFAYSDGILEPLTLLIPNLYGGSSRQNIFNDPNSASRKALQQQGIQYDPNQMALPAYWGDQPFTAPYYGGAIMVFLFAVGVAFAERKFLWWLLPASVLGIMMSWGSNFETFNYFIFDYLPGYNKFRSVTFALVIVFFALPLIGMLGLEKLFEKGLNKTNWRKLFIALAVTGGFCLALAWGFSMLFAFTNDREAGNIPPWLMSALMEDRENLLQNDAYRSVAFILATFVMLCLVLWKKIPSAAFYTFLMIMVTIDLAAIDRRYLSKDNYQRNHKAAAFTATPSDQEILADKTYYRVYNLTDGTARPSYYHNSLTGYHGAPLRRYQDLMDSCIEKQTEQLIQGLQAQQTDFSRLSVLNMLNAKYFVFGPDRNNMIENASANGNAWFVREVVPVTSANEELKKVSEVNTKDVAVLNTSEFKVSDFEFDSSATISIAEYNPNYLKYESQSAQNGLVVFSEIYYPKGWIATIDGAETEIIRADYTLRALQVPAGKHTIEFRFEPKPYIVGNKITMVSSWLLLLALLGSLGWSWKEFSKEM